MKLRAPTIGAAAVLAVGMLLALITGNAARRLLATLAALAAAGALAYVIYFAAPDYLKEANAEMTGGEGVTLDVTLESAPAIGFWAIIGVLAVVVLLQLVPTPSAAPAAAAAPPPGQHGIPAQPVEPGTPVAGSPPPPSY